MAATALIGMNVKVAGVESAESLAGQVYELVSRFTASAAPGVVESGHVDTGANNNWAVLKSTAGASSGAMDSVKGLIIVNEGAENLEVDLTFLTTEYAELVILPGEACFVAPGLVGGESEIKVRSADAAGTTYEFVVFGPAVA